MGPPFRLSGIPWFEWVAAGNAVDGGWGNVDEGASETGGLQVEPVEAGFWDGAERAVSELIEGSAGVHAAKGSAQQGEHFCRGHVEQGKTADDGSDGVLRKESLAMQSAGVHLEDACGGEALLEELSEVGTALDEGEVLLTDALVEERLGEDTGSRAELDDGAGVAADFAGDEAGERGAGGCDGANLGGICADGAQESKFVFQVGVRPPDFRPVDEGPVHTVSSSPRDLRNLSAGCGKPEIRGG